MSLGKRLKTGLTGKCDVCHEPVRKVNTTRVGDGVTTHCPKANCPFAGRLKRK